MNEESKRLCVICNCGDCEHQLIFSAWLDEDPLMFLNVHIMPDPRLLHRIYNALRHVFGFRSKYGEFGEVILDRAEAIRVATFLNEWAKAQDVVTTTATTTNTVYASNQP